MRQETLRGTRREPIARFEAQNIGDRDTIEMAADFPGGKNSCVDKLVDRFPAELPAAAELENREPGGTRVSCDRTCASRRHSAPPRRRGLPTFATHGALFSRNLFRQRIWFAERYACLCRQRAQIVQTARLKLPSSMKGRSPFSGQCVAILYFLISRVRCHQ